MKKAGGEPRAPFQGFAYVVRADKKALAAIAALPIVRWVGHLPHKARVAFTTRRRLEGGKQKAAIERRGPQDAPP